MSAKKDLTGKKFSRWTVLECAGHDKYGQSLWRCKCDCGNEALVTGYDLRGARSKSCGCLQREAASKSQKTHGESKTKLHSHWTAMKQRCLNKNSSCYYKYGGRGISVCDEWLDYNNFMLWAISNGYKDGLTIDRINYNGNYEPSNCRWVDAKSQANNKRSNHWITYNGKTQTMMQWAEELGINYYVIRSRLNSYHWSVEKTFTTPVRKAIK